MKRVGTRRGEAFFKISPHHPSDLLSYVGLDDPSMTLSCDSHLGPQGELRDESMVEPKTRKGLGP